jgi:EpsI family protein
MLKPAMSLAFLRRGPALLVTCILVVEAVLFYLVPTTEHVPNPPPLSSFRADLGPWKQYSEIDLDPETQSFLKADDTVNRNYAGSEGWLSLFVAFFKSQRGGVTPHSPKICLPGNGWTPEGSRTITVSIPGDPKPIPMNRYLVRHGEERIVVLYWYATAHHTVADEYLSKLYLMHEGLRYRRSDEAVYRVMAPVLADGQDRAEARAIEFIRTFYPPLKQQMWSE